MKNNFFLSWFMKKGYLQGVFWANMISVFSVMNDLIMLHLGNRLHHVEISFFRFIFSALTMIPLMIPLTSSLKINRGTNYFFTKNIFNNFARGIIGAMALGICCYSVQNIALSENTSIMFMEPIFVLLLAPFFLSEKVGKMRWIATILSFLGLIIMIQPWSLGIRIVYILPIIAAFLFSILDVMAKKMIQTDHKYTMLFYFGVFASIVPGIILLTKPELFMIPSFFELFILMMLGAGGNLIQMCLFRAFSATDASGLMPFRYSEYILSVSLGFLIFSQIPGTYSVIGSIIIIASNFFISYMEIRKEKLLLKKDSEKDVKKRLVA